MGNCAGYCTGEAEEKNEHHTKNNFNKIDLQDLDFEKTYADNRQ